MCRRIRSLMPGSEIHKRLRWRKRWRPHPMVYLETEGCLERYEADLHRAACHCMARLYALPGAFQ